MERSRITDQNVVQPALVPVQEFPMAPAYRLEQMLRKANSPFESAIEYQMDIAPATDLAERLGLASCI
jgi:hypothetical protein